MMSLSDDKLADIIGALRTTSRYLDDIINTNQVILTIWQVKYTNKSSKLIELIPLILKPHLCLHLCISNNIVSTKIYDKREDFDFEIVISHF